MPKMLMFKIGAEGEFRIAKKLKRQFSFTVGRGSENQVVVPKDLPESEKVSRQHLLFFRDSEGYWIEDLGARNFTFVNGKVVLFRTKVSLPPSCMINMGPVPMEISIEDQDQHEYESCLESSFLAPEQDQVGTADHFLSHFEVGDAWDEFGKCLHWSRALLNVAEKIGLAVEVEQVEAGLRQSFHQHLGAEEVYLGIGLLNKEIPDALRESGLALDSAKRIQVAFNNFRPESTIVQTSNPRSSMFGWAIRGRGDQKNRVSFAVVRVSEKGKLLAESDEATSFVTFSLRTAERVRGILLELESYRVMVPRVVTHEPSPEVRDLALKLGFCGASPAFQRCLYTAERAAKGFFELGDRQGLPTILIQGEIGTGKTALARLIHALSSRSKELYVEKSCTEMAPDLITSELFGHKKGAFSGAVSDRTGVFDLARGGTLLLDEIGHTRKEFQSTLLRVIQNGRFNPVGGNEEHVTDAFLILASQQDLETLTQEGKFLEDLWSRIDAFIITVPPLRERYGDLEILIKNKLASVRAETNFKSVHRVSNQLMELFNAYHWPRNVRELMNVIESSLGMAGEEVNELGVEHLQSQHLESLLNPKIVEMKCDTSGTLDENTESLERVYIARLVNECEGNMSKVIERSGKAGATIYNKIAKIRAWAQTAPPQEVAALRALAGEHWIRIAGEDEI